MMSLNVLEEDSLIQSVSKELELGIYPQYIGHEENAIHKMLLKRKNLYNPDLNGIMLRFENLEFLSDTGRIVDDGPFIFWKIKANFHIFNVEPDQIVKSTINRIGKEYFGCILANCIDVTIKFDENCDRKTTKEIYSSLSVGDAIIFKVKSFVPTQKYIDGIIDSDVVSLWKT